MIEGENGRISVCGTYGDSGPIVEIGARQIVPENTVVLDDTPTSDEEYERNGCVALSPEAARELADDIRMMADQVEDDE